MQLHRSSYGGTAKTQREDFIRCGLVEAVKGMETYQETAVAMGREPYSGAELDAAKKVKDQLILENKDLNSGSGWARHHVGGTRFVKHLQKAAEFEQIGVRLQVGKPERSRNLPGTESTPRDE